MPATVLFVTLKIVEDKMGPFIDRVLEHRGNVLGNEPDCLRFDVSKPNEDENIIRLYEVYATEAAFKHHMETDYMKAYSDETSPMIMSLERVQAELFNST